MNDIFHPHRRGRPIGRSSGRRLLASGLAALALACIMSGCNSVPEFSGNGLFSWSDEVPQGERRDGIFQDMAACELTILYQSFPGDAEPESVREFLRAAAEREIGVYLLTGAPEWGLDPEGADMAAEVERCGRYNRGLPAGTRLRGVMMDVEPYLTEEWDQDPAGVMDAYVSGMTTARAAAQKDGLQYFACIPWFYDTKGLEEGLGELISSGCDGLAVMNYQKRDEAGQIEAEAAMARESAVPLTVIYELQAPGTHDLTEYNTYHKEGLEAVAESFRALEERFGERPLYYALHDGRALREVLERE